MKRTIALLLGFIFSVCATANAKPISEYIQMTAYDEGQYVRALVKGSVDALRSRGNDKDGDKLFKLFTAGDGASQLVKNLGTLNSLDKKNVSDPNNKQPPYEVEQAFALTLKDNGIIVPLNFLLSINKDFKPASSK